MRLCVGCKHFVLTFGNDDSGCPSCGYGHTSSAVECRKREFTPLYGDELNARWRATIILARGCKYYVLRDDLKP